MTTRPAAIRRMPRWLLSVHMYGGLLTSSYLVLYGLTSVIGNHRPNRLTGTRSVHEWTRTVPLPPPQVEPSEAARQIVNGLGLSGRILPGQATRGADGALEFRLLRPGRVYQLRAAPNGAVQVEEERERLVNVLAGLHDAKPYPDSLALTSWWYFTGVTFAILLLLSVTGVLVWASAKRARRVGLQLLVGGPLMLVLLLVWLMS